MKKLIALFAVLGFAPCAYSADGADFSHSGDFRLQYKNDMNKDGNTDAADTPSQNWHQRLRWGTNVRAGEKLSAQFTLVHNTDWGSLGAEQVPDDIGDTTPTGGTISNNLLIVNEAYATWMASDAWMLRFGRGSITLADGRLISTNEYEPVANAFDGGLASWDQEFARMSFFAVEALKLGRNDFGRLYGAAFDFKTLPDFIKTAHLHVINVKIDPAGTTGEDNMRVGLVVGGDMAGADYRLTYENESGKHMAAAAPHTKTDIATSMIDAEVGYTLAAMMNTRFHVGYHTDTGTKSGNDDKTYNGFYYDVHNNAGLMDIVGFGNLTYLHAGVDLSASDDITVGANYLMFSKTEKQDKVYGPRTSVFASVAGVTGATNKTDIGNELDVWAAKKYTNNFSIKARYSMFEPGDVYKASGLEDTYSQIYLESKLTF